tara:strand:- start:517 stop:759 length:243 start_codon:yes stop_codon:yes gene_type:complete
MSNFTDFFPAPSASVEAGTTAQRPASPTAGVARFNTTLRKYELHDGSNWVQLDSLRHHFKTDLNLLTVDSTTHLTNETKY